MVNEELTAEEWKRRYEKEKEKNACLTGLVERYEAELAKWRAGDSTNEDCFFNSLKLSENIIVRTQQCLAPKFSFLKPRLISAF